MSHKYSRTVPQLLAIGSSPRFEEFHSASRFLVHGHASGARGENRGIPGAHCETIDLSRMNIHPCRGCFSDMETRCHFLCDCHDDDFRMIAEKMMAADGIVFATPTYMFGISSVLKRFFERWVSFKAPPIDQGVATKSLDECFDLLHKLADGTLKASNPLKGKVGAVVVAGSELGQDGVIREIMLTLNLYGFVFPPQAFLYHTGHSMQSLEDVRTSFYENKWLAVATETLAHNFVQMIRLTRGATWHQIPTTVAGK